MSDPRKNIAAIAPCGCVRILMVTESPEHKASAREMADFWRSVADSKVELKVQEFTDESWKPLPWNCSVCRPATQPQLF